MFLSRLVGPGYSGSHLPILEEYRCSMTCNERKEDFTFFCCFAIILQALENSPPEQDSPPEQSSPPEQCYPPQQQQIDSDPFSSDYEGSFLDGFSDLDSSDNEVFLGLTNSFLCCMDFVVVV